MQSLKKIKDTKIIGAGQTCSVPMAFNVLFLSIAAFAFVFLTERSANAESTYVEATLADVQAQEQLESQHAQELEAQALQQREARDRRIRETEIKINAIRTRIESLKQRQEQAKNEIQANVTDVKDREEKAKQLKEQSAQYELDTKTAIESLSKIKEDLAAQVKDTDSTLRTLHKEKSEAETAIYSKQADIQRLKKESAELLTRKERAEAARAELETEEMKTRTVWMQAKLDIAEKQRLADDSVAESKAQKARYEAAVSELNDARVALAKAEKIRAETENRTNNDVERYNAEREKAMRNKAVAEADRLRLESDVSRLQEYALRVKESRDSANDESESAASLVLKARMDQQTASSDVEVQNHADKQSEAKKRKHSAEVRGLAAASEASDLFGNVREWVSTEACTSFVKPSAGSSAFGKFKEGRKSMAREAAPGWIEIVRGSSDPLYIKSSCGKFSE